MTTERMRRRIQANATTVADGLEKLQDDMLALFNSQLDHYRNEMLKRDDEHVAMLKTFIDELGAVKAGITGLSQQLSEYEALVPAPERVRAIAQIADHEARIRALEQAEASDDANG